MKPVKGWVVIDPDDGALIWTFCTLRKASIYELTNGWRWHYNQGWRWHYNRGYRCVRVTLRSD